MTKIDLERKLLKDGIDENSFSLDGGLPNEKYCLNYSGTCWEVYYSERGQKTNIKIFATEGEACEYFYKTLIKSLQEMGLI